MLAYAMEAVMLMRDRRRADLDTDRALGLAVLRCVEIVGERKPAVFTVAIRRRHPNIPWAQIGLAMRNRLIHGYDIVDYDIVMEHGCPGFAVAELLNWRRY